MTLAFLQSTLPRSAPGTVYRPDDPRRFDNLGEPNAVVQWHLEPWEGIVVMAVPGQTEFVVWELHVQYPDRDLLNTTQSWIARLQHSCPQCQWFLPTVTEGKSVWGLTKPTAPRFRHWPGQHVCPNGCPGSTPRHLLPSGKELVRPRDGRVWLESGIYAPGEVRPFVAAGVNL